MATTLRIKDDQLTDALDFYMSSWVCLSLSHHASQTNISSFFWANTHYFPFLCVCPFYSMVFSCQTAPSQLPDLYFMSYNFLFPCGRWVLLMPRNSLKFNKFGSVRKHISIFFEETDLKVQLIHICVCSHLFKRVIYRSYFTTFIWLRIQPPSNRSLLTPWTPCCFIQNQNNSPKTWKTSPKTWKKPVVNVGPEKTNIPFFLMVIVNVITSKLVVMVKWAKK